MLSTLLAYVIASTKCREGPFNFTRKICSGAENYNEMVLFGM